ncbi:hypothetical protein GCM10009731_11570 [Streptomyces globosus]
MPRPSLRTAVAAAATALAAAVASLSSGAFAGPAAHVAVSGFPTPGAVRPGVWFGHQQPGQPGYQPPHEHVRPGDDTRNGVPDGAEAHYYHDVV